MSISLFIGVKWKHFQKCQNQIILPYCEKSIYKRKKQSSLISTPAPKKVKVNKIIIKNSGANSSVTQSMFGMIGRKGNLIFLLLMSFQLLPKIGSLIKTVKIFLLHNGNSDRI